MQWSRAIAWRRRHAAPIGVAAVATVALLAFACGSDDADPGAQAVREVAPAQAAAEEAPAEQAAAERQAETEATEEAPAESAAEDEPEAPAAQSAAESQPQPEDRAETQAEAETETEATAEAPAESAAEDEPEATAEATAEDEPEATAEATAEDEPEATAEATAEDEPEATAEATAEDEPASDPPPPDSGTFLPLDADVTPAGEPILRDLGAPSHFGRGWNTNFDISLVDYTEILSGGVPRDGIPTIRDPRFISIAEADGVYVDHSPVMQVSLNGDARAYPLDILIWHEIVADVVGGVPVAVTFCPLCNTAITFDRTIAGTVYDFGVSGLLRNSDLIMYDSQTESLWQQIGGAAIVGDMVGARLTVLPSTIVAWGDFKAQYPEGIVLSRETGYARRYGANPYVGYDRIGNTPFLFRGEIDERLSAMERVVTLDLPGEVVAYPFTLLAERRAVADVRDGREIVVFWTPGVTSALDGADIARSRDVGATGVFERSVDGRLLDFQPNPDDPATFLDAQTQSVWNIFGSARSGPLAGTQLTPVVHANHFWFAWAAFQPDTVVFGG